MATFAERVKELRLQKGMTQDALADFFCLSRNAVTKWEQGKSEPDYATAVRLADFFGVTTDYLLGRTDQPNAGFPLSAAVISALPPILDRMFAKERLQSTAQIALYTNGVLTAEEIERLRRGESPTAFDEALLVRFFRKFDLDLIREYYRAAHVPLPQDYQDIEAELRGIIDRISMSTNNSPEALEFVIRLAKEEFAKRGK